jgi:hypothetical protein
MLRMEIEKQRAKKERSKAAPIFIIGQRFALTIY